MIEHVCLDLFMVNITDHMIEHVCLDLYMVYITDHMIEHVCLDLFIGVHYRSYDRARLS